MTGHNLINLLLTSVLFAFGSASWLRRIVTTSMCPFKDAQCSAVSPCAIMIQFDISTHLTLVLILNHNHALALLSLDTMKTYYIRDRIYSCDILY